jgi:hypothetical protein
MLSYIEHSIYRNHQNMESHGIPSQAADHGSDLAIQDPPQGRTANNRIFLPFIIRKNRLRYNDVGARGGRNQSNRFTQSMLAYRNKLCVEELYVLRQTNAEKRRIQEMLLEFVERNDGRVVKDIRHRKGYCYVVPRQEALTVMAAKLREGPDITAIDDGSIGTISTQSLEVDNDVNISEISFV